MKKLVLLSAMFILALGAMAQGAPMMESKPVEMATGLYASGKIYVVVAVLVTILVGLFAYLIYIDKKISKLEK